MMKTIEREPLHARIRKALGAPFRYLARRRKEREARLDYLRRWGLCEECERNEVSEGLGVCENCYLNRGF